MHHRLGNFTLHCHTKFLEILVSVLAGDKGRKIFDRVEAQRLYVTSNIIPP